MMPLTEPLFRFAPLLSWTPPTLIAFALSTMIDQREMAGFSILVLAEATSDQAPS